MWEQVRAAVEPVSDYSAAAKVGGGSLVFVSGQVPVDAEGATVGRGDVEAQMRKAIENLRCAVEAAGGSLKDVVKLNVYVTRREHYEVFRRLRREYFSAPFPAATGVVVAGLLDPDWLVEIEAVAVVDDPRP